MTQAKIDPRDYARCSTCDFYAAGQCTLWDRPMSPQFGCHRHPLREAFEVEDCLHSYVNMPDADAITFDGDRPDAEWRVYTRQKCVKCGKVFSGSAGCYE